MNSHSSRVLLVGNFSKDDQRSMLSYADVLEAGLQSRGYFVRVASPQIFLSRLAGGSKFLGKWLGYADKFIVFSAWLFLIHWRYDRVHVCDHSNGFYGFLLTRSRSTITCHDVIAIKAALGEISEWRASFTGKLFQKLAFSGLKRFRKVFCVSGHTQRQLLGLGHPFDTSIAENCLNANFFPGAQRNDFHTMGVPSDPSCKYFLHVGSDHPRKNRPFLFEILSRLSIEDGFSSVHLILVGPPASEELRNRLEKLGLTHRVHFLGDVKHSFLVQLYGNALGLLFPSLYEGFGWPLVEAQACGCPVFTSRLEPMLEICADAAEYFDPLIADSAVQAILRADLEMMKERGLRNAKRFTVENMLDRLEFPFNA